MRFSARYRRTDGRVRMYIPGSTRAASVEAALTPPMQATNSPERAAADHAAGALSPEPAELAEQPGLGLRAHRLVGQVVAQLDGQFEGPGVLALVGA